MSRDDSILSTGASSASFASPKAEQVEEKRKEIQETKKEERQKLTPVIELLTDFVQAEINEVQNINFLNVEEMLTDEHFKSEMMARKKYVAHLTALKNKMANIMRELK